MTRWKRLLIAEVRPLPARRKLNRLDQRLGENLRAQKIHPEVRHLWRIEDTAVRIRTERKPHLLRSVPEILGWLVDIVHQRFVAPQVRVERGVGGMYGGGEAAAKQRQVGIVLRREMPEVVAEVPEEGVNAGMGRRGRRFFFIRLG